MCCPPSHECRGYPPLRNPAFEFLPHLRLTQKQIRMIQLLLYFLIVPAHMQPIHEGMVALHAQRHLECVTLAEILAPGEPWHGIDRR